MSPSTNAALRKPEPVGANVLVHQHCWSRGDGPGPTGEWKDSNSFWLGEGRHDIDRGKGRGPGGWDGTDLSSIHWDPKSVEVTVVSNQGHSLKLARPGYCLQDTDATRHYDNNVRTIVVTRLGTGDGAGYEAPVVSDVVTMASGGAGAPAPAPAPSGGIAPPPATESAGGGGDGGGGGGAFSSTALVGGVVALAALLSCSSVLAVVATSGGSRGGGDGGDDGGYGDDSY